MQALINKLNSIQQEIAEHKSARLARLALAYQECNQDMTPTMDVNGRPHAPCDGYCIPDTLDFPQGVQEYYGKGEFLPIPVDMITDDCIIKLHWSFTHRIKCPVEIVECLNQNFNEWCDASHGKVWVENEVSWCYMTLTANPSFGRKVAIAIKEYVSNLNVDVVKGESPEGKQTIKGTIVAIKVVEGLYGYERKMMVLMENNATVYGTVPSSISHVVVGSVVAFSANFEKSDRVGHSFFKRPTKACLV